MIGSHAALDPAARRLMAEIGPVWANDIQGHRDLVLRAYGPVLARAPRAGAAIMRDIAYGAEPRQRLDYIVPADARRAPVVLFVHGGAFVRGDKRLSEEVYDNVLFWFARQGFAAVNVEYRLAPASVWPGGADDLGLAIAWVRANIAGLGGNPEAIVAIGHSAGATHVGTYAYDPAAGYLGRDLSGIVLLSPRVRIDASKENPNAAGVIAYFGDDPATYAVRSPVTHAAASTLPAMIAVAEYENPLLDVYALELAYVLARARGRAPPFIRLAGHNHMSLVAHLNSGEAELGEAIADFVRRPA
jgi:acetyl esterase/lipase